MSVDSTAAGRAVSSPGYTAALAVLTTVFFMWGFATVLNDILVPHLKAVFDLNYGQSLLIQFAFYLGYLLMAIPSAKLLERTGYKMAVVLGLVGMAGSALVFVPAARLESYGVFLVALFLLASSITLLQVAANPYVTVIGPARTASSRLNLVQAFNSMGTTLAPLFGGLLILGRSSSGTETGAAVALSAQQRAADVQAVQLPYLLIAAVLIALAVLVWRVRLPDLGQESRRANQAERAKHSLWRHRNLVFGVPAICLYLVCEIGIGSTLVNFISMPNIGAMSHAAASGYLSLFWGGAMVGRFIGAALLRWVAPERMLAAVSLGALVLVLIAITTGGPLAMWSLIAIGLCHSVMFPTIFTLGIRGLGPLTEEGSGLLIMAIAGGALSALQGVLADHVGLQLSYLLPAVCYLYVLGYALWGSRATEELQAERLGT
ncbi:MAG TPA: sugar MFS transporter [Steroidobacteraceae bacterium]|nr:sugar MFS transporter [Steroidobacteraceae bacterium]